MSMEMNKMVQMNNLYHVKGEQAWFRKQGEYAFDFVSDKKFASIMTEEECQKIVNGSDFYCKMFAAESMEIIPA